ncbi:MAG: RagB/SusD family nutrient uptake outer membrane protein [Bacteroidota bacterium]
MKTLYKSIVTLAALILFMGSCEDYLEITPLDSLSSESVLTTEGGRDVLLNALYVADDNLLWANRTGYVYMGDVGTDIMYFRLNNNFRRNVEEHNTDATSAIPGHMWDGIFRTVESTNSIIELIDESPLEENLKEEGIAEARFMRAWSYFNAVRLFGDVPIFTNAVTTVAEAQDSLAVDNSRRPVLDVFQEIIEPDLQYAMEFLPEESRLPSTPTSWAAHALLAKAYIQGAGQFGLNNDYWNRAVVLLRELISDSPYSLEVASYDEIFTLENEVSGNQRIWVDKWTRVPSGSNHMVFFGPVETNIAGKQIWPDGQSGNRRQPGHPYIAFYNTYEGNDLRKDVAITDYTAFYTDDETGEVSGLSRATASTHAVNKYFYDEVAKASDGRDGHDKIFIRYADVYLMLAEALNEANGGPTAEAFTAINTIRMRAGIPNLSVADNIDGHFTYGAGSQSVGSRTGFRNAVLRERAWELCYEGHRRHDLNRYNLLDDVVLNKNSEDGWSEEQPFPVTNWVNGRELFPIPENVVILNNWDQNPGY